MKEIIAIPAEDVEYVESVRVYNVEIPKSFIERIKQERDTWWRKKLELMQSNLATTHWCNTKEF